MSYYGINKQELLQKTKDKYHDCGGKEKAAIYYLKSRGVLKGKAKNKYKNLSEEEKEARQVLNILLATKVIIPLDLYALFYLK